LSKHLLVKLGVLILLDQEKVLDIFMLNVLDEYMKLINKSRVFFQEPYNFF